VWAKFANYVAQKHDLMNLRELSLCAYSFTTISKNQPILMNFDDLYVAMELSFIKKFDSEKVDG
jgi:hypothetical protein